MGADEKAALTKVASELSAELNEQLEEAKKTMRRVDPKERKARNLRAQKRARLRRRNSLEKVYCAGINLAGKPCRQAPLLKANWDGDEEITGLYCLHHEPNINTDERESFRLFGSSKHPVYRRVTPSEIAHQLVQRSPQYFLGPYLKALGLRLNDDGELEKIGTGLKLYGYSRGGEVRRSQYPDLVGQVNITEKLLDRLYGKARQAVDVAAQTTTVQVHVVMDADRVGKVADVLKEAGALTNGNGNGHEELEEPEEITDAEVVEED